MLTIIITNVYQTLYMLGGKKDLLRIRYTTSHPKDMTQDLLEAHKIAQNLCLYYIFPVQSGSDKILKNMNRKHNIKEYLEIIKHLKKKIQK